MIPSPTKEKKRKKVKEKKYWSKLNAIKLVTSAQKITYAQSINNQILQLLNN